MSKIYNLGAAVFLCLSMSPLVYSQNPEHQVGVNSFRTHAVTSPSAMVEVHGEAAVGSNFLQPALVWNAYWSREMLANQISDINSEVLRLGYVAEARFDYLFQENVKGKRYWFSLGHQTNLGLRTTEDAVRLFLNGNSPYKGKEMVLGRTAMEYGNYSYLKVGSLKQSGNGTFTGGVGFYFSANKGGVNAEELTLYTDSLARYVSMTGELDGYRVQQNGLGFGLDFGYTLSLPKMRLNIQLNDIGLVYYSGVRLQGTNGEDVRFQGVRIHSLQDRIDFTQVEDSLRAAHYAEDTASIMYVLPFTLKAEGHHVLKNLNGIGWRTQYRYISGYLPSVTGYYQQTFRGGNALRLGATAGGFGYFGSVLETDIRVGSNLLIQAQATGLENALNSNGKSRFSARVGVVFRPK